MKEDLKFSIYDELGNETICRIICSFFNVNNKNHYLVYTDDSYDKNNKLNIYAAIFDPNDDSVFEEVKSDEEWKYIDNFLKGLGD